MNLGFAGVDLLEGKDGPQIMEINSSPGLEGIEQCTKVDVAGTIVEYIAARVDFPEIDLRQRVNISKGYGVTEINIPEGSKYVGQKISDSGLWEEDINVLTLHRAGKVTPNPKASKELEANDRLLCFGKLESMRKLVPEKTRKRRKPKPKKLPKSASQNPRNDESLS